MKFKGAIYRLLFAGLLFAQLLPHIEAQSNSPTNNSSTNNVPIPTDHPTGLGAFDDAYSRTDCYIIWMRVRMKKQDYFDELLKPHRTTYKAAQAKCDEKKIELDQNKLQHQAAIIDAENDVQNTLLTCIGLGSLATGVASRTGSRWVVSRQGSRVDLSRVAGGLATVVVGFWLGCSRLANKGRNHAEGVANQIKVNADKLTELSYQNCIKENVKSHRDKYDSVMRSRNARLAIIDDNYQRCVEFFRNQQE